MQAYKTNKSGLLVPARHMDKSEFDRILRDEGIKSARLRDEFWKIASRRQPLTEEAVRLAVKKAIAREPDMRWRTF